LYRCSPRCVHCVLMHVSLSSTDAAPAVVYPLSLHDALPIFPGSVLYLRALSIGAPAILLFISLRSVCEGVSKPLPITIVSGVGLDRKSTRLNSSHVSISYAVFCLKKKKRNKRDSTEE